MKLTDANKIRDYVKEQINPYGKPFEGSVYEFGLKIMHYIDNMQTDYDTESVVEELEKQRDIIFQNTDSEIRTVRASAWDKIDILNKAIEIVKQVSVYDDCCEWRYNDTEYCLESSCNHLQIFMDDCPKQNEYSFCPYCGKKIKVVE